MKHMAVFMFALISNVLFTTMFICQISLYNGIMCLLGVTLCVLLCLYELDNIKE